MFVEKTQFNKQNAIMRNDSQRQAQNWFYDAVPKLYGFRLLELSVKMKNSPCLNRDGTVQ